MFIEVVIQEEIVYREQVEMFEGNEYQDYKIRELLIARMINKLKMVFPFADFQLAFESRIHLIEE